MFLWVFNFGVSAQWKVYSELIQRALLSSGSRALVSLSAEAKKHSNSVMFCWREKKYLWLTYCILAFSITFHLFPCFCWVRASRRSHLDATPPLLLGAIKAQAFDLTMNKIQKCFLMHSVEWAAPLSSVNVTLALFSLQNVCQPKSWQKKKSGSPSALMLVTVISISHSYISHLCRASTTSPCNWWHVG